MVPGTRTRGRCADGGRTVAGVCSDCQELVRLADRRIRALQRLMACYRVGRHASEALHEELDDSGEAWERIGREWGLHDGPNA